MDKNKEPGILFRGVYLVSLQFERSPETPKEFHYALSLNVSKRIEDKEDGGKSLFLILEADPMHDVEEKAFEMQVKIMGVFDAERNSNLLIEEFAEIQAPALMVPYLREVISSVTSRSGMPALVLPPINVHALLGAQKKGLAESEKNKRAVTGP